MMDTLICGALTYTACVVGTACGLGWMRAIKDRDAARAEQRRLKAWADHWQKQATTLADYLSRIPSRRGAHAKACQADQQRAKVRETAERLAAGK